MSSPELAPAPSPLPAELEPLLTPIAGPHPGGVELRYDPLYDQVKEARREDDDTPQGDWVVERKTADWPTVVRLTTQALSTRTKDLQLAAWLTEAKLRREGLPGLHSGLVLLRELMDRFWEHLYPEIEDGDAEYRAAPLEWLGGVLDLPIRRVPLTRAGHHLISYKESRTIPTEQEAGEDDGKAATRAARLADGKVAPEEVDRAFDGTPKAFYKQLNADLASCLEALAQLDARASERFGAAAPSFARLRETLEDLQRTARQLLKKKLEQDPDPVAAAEAPAAEQSTLVDAVLDAAATPARGPAPSVGAEPTSRDDAAARVAAAARWLRRAAPHDPAPYLMLRGLRWGELRARGGTPDPRLLEAPTTATRTRLKGLLLDGKWAELLEEAENVMGMPQGRGWLDLQRYAVAACEGLGGDHLLVADAIRGALRSLLADVPALVDMTMMDDTPTANAETRAWLREIAPASNGAASSDDEAPAPADARPRDVGGAAASEARAGRPDRAIQLLMREIDRERSQRGRFLLQAQLARVMVESGHHAVATPILEELLQNVDAHKLDEWEAGDVVARPFSLLYRCLEQSGEDAARRQEIYLRICRLDPLQAMQLAGGTSAEP